MDININVQGELLSILYLTTWIVFFRWIVIPMIKVLSYNQGKD